MAASGAGNQGYIMAAPSKIYMNWSSGKDAAMALHYLLQDSRWEVGQLLTSVNAHHNRVSMHGLRRSMLEAQVAAIGIPARTLELPEEPGMQEYQQIMSEAAADLRAQGYADTAFGDIFLEDLRAYRETQLQQLDIKAHFPLWQRDTRELMQSFVSMGFKAVAVCVNTDLLDTSFAGREIDASFVHDLPAHIDPCGENGEFHTFCYDAPYFKHPVAFRQGERIDRSYRHPSGEGAIGFCFQDLIPLSHV
jgi:uncharacterized protein (TIGR00290 family)